MDVERLTLHNVTLSDAGLYTCVVNNAYGQIQQSAWIEVLTTRPADGSPSDNVVLFVAIVIAFGAFAVAVVIVAMCWRRHQPPKSRPIIFTDSPIYFQSLNLPVDPQWEISRLQ